MRAMVEGPWWAGQWTELAVAELQRLGFDTDISYHNRKTIPARIAKKLNKRIPETKEFFDWEVLCRRKLFNRLASGAYDLFFSIQGPLDSVFFAELKQEQPGIKTVYWQGDVFSNAIQSRLDGLKEASRSGTLDALLVSYYGTLDYLEKQGVDNAHYFPFGYSRELHQTGEITAQDRKRFSSEVSFVGTCYPGRVELISYLNRHLPTPVRVWGRSWRGSGIRSGGRLTLQESLKVYACSKISLNIHHHWTQNGFNMKFYEIPAAGGFQLCDGQSVLKDSPLRETPSFTTKEELLAHVMDYLGNDTKREALAQHLQSVTLQQCDYSIQFAKITEGLMGAKAKMDIAAARGLR